MTSEIFIFLALSLIVAGLIIAGLVVTILKNQKKHQKIQSDLMQAQQKDQTNLALSQQELQLEKEKLQSEKEKIEEFRKEYETQKMFLKNEFKVLSEEIFKEKQQTFKEENKLGMDAILKPLGEQIQNFRQRVDEIQIEAVKGHASLEGEIKKVMEMGLKMSDEASNLTSALKGDSQQRGAWGEAQLERTLEMSGLVEEAHYEKQTSLKDEEGQIKRTDYLIKLPDNKHMVIDSKVSLNDYDRVVASKTESQKNAALDKYIKAVRGHVNDLASKDYANIEKLKSPSFVLMFMPIEPAYIEALKHDKGLFDYGYEKKVIMVSHTTLIPILRTVANLWKLQKSNEEARKMSHSVGSIYNSVCTVGERFQKLGHQLITVNKQYNDVVTAISGKQGLHGKVEHFQEISDKIKKQMPEIQEISVDYEIKKLDIQRLPQKSLEEK